MAEAGAGAGAAGVASLSSPQAATTRPVHIAAARTPRLIADIAPRTTRRAAGFPDLRVEIEVPAGTELQARGDCRLRAIWSPSPRSPRRSPARPCPRPRPRLARD